jgi:hypothetical protein
MGLAVKRDETQEANERKGAGGIRSETEGKRGLVRANENRDVPIILRAATAHAAIESPSSESSHDSESPLTAHK